MIVLDELNPITIDEESQGMQLAIEHSFTDPYLFVFCREADKWSVKYYLQLPLKRIKEILIRIDAPKNKTFGEVFGDEQIIKALYEEEPILTWKIDGNLGHILQRLYDEGLPTPGKKPSGFDGHHYRLKVFGKEEYECWQILPYEWDLLESLIDNIIASTGISQKTYGCTREQTPSE